MPPPDDPAPERDHLSSASGPEIDSYEPSQPIDLEPYPQSQGPRRVLLPILLFAVTCASTYLAGGPVFALTLMLILTTHELGHFLQAVRYGVPASLPYFIPMPISPIGTMGAVIAMRGGLGNRKSLFDIGISGPLAGLVPAIAASVVGLKLSTVAPIARVADGHVTGLGVPLLFKLLVHFIFGPLKDTERVMLHPIAYAGWVGVFITGLNLIPIGQLDGGHVLYALLRRRAHLIAVTLLWAALLAVMVWGYWGWSLMLLLLALLGPRHPPTANDDMPLGTFRTILGWLTLAFLVLGFTPEPFYIGE